MEYNEAAMARYLLILPIACMTRQDLQSLGRALGKDPEVQVQWLLATQSQGKMFLQCRCSDRNSLDAFMKRCNLRTEDVFRIELEFQNDSLVDV